MAWYTSPAFWSAVGTAVGANQQNKTNKQNRELQDEYAKQGVGWKIEQAKKYGIHPSVAIGASQGPMPTIAMQNPLANLSGGLSNAAAMHHQQKSDEIDAELKKYALEEAKARAYDRLFEYELLIPVTHKDYPGQTIWAFNPKYLAYGTFATAVVIDANKDGALKKFKEMITPTEGGLLDKTLKFLNQSKEK